MAHSPYLSASSCGSCFLRLKGKSPPALSSQNKTCVLTLRSRSAAEIDELYENKVPAWRWSKTVTAVEEQMHVVVLVKGAINEERIEQA
jgi:hypothetical protein